MVGDYVFYWKPQAHKLDPFRWHGPALVVSVEASLDRKTMVYWIVHGSSLVRTTRQQLRFESIPERNERQSRPGHLKNMKRPFDRATAGSIQACESRAIDIASKAQNPEDFPQLGGTMPAAHAPGDAPPHEPADPPNAKRPAVAVEAETETTTSSTIPDPKMDPKMSSALQNDPEVQPERKKAKLPQPLRDFWVDYDDSEKSESEAKTTDKTALDEMVENRDKDLDDHTEKMTEAQRALKQAFEKQHPGALGSAQGVVG